MATVKLFRRIEKTNEKGQAPLYIRIIKDRRVKYVSLGIKLTAKEWDEGKSKVTKSHKNSVYMNAFIAQKVADAEAVALTMEIKPKGVTSRKIKEKIMGKVPTDFFLYAARYTDALSKSDKYGMYKRVDTVINKLSKYMDGQQLMVDDITFTFLKEYEDYLSSELHNTTNTITSNFKIIRKILNDAIKDDIITHNDNPFYKFKLKTEQSKREFLTDEEILKIENLKLDPGTSLYDYRNAYIFASYAGGIRISDILQLKWKNFDGERINIMMSKTNRQLNIKLPQKALDIILIYKKRDSQINDFIFPFLRNDKDYSTPKVLHHALASATTLANTALVTIAFKAKVKKHLSFHTSRHTFATRALRKGVRIEYVSKLLGHSSIKETQVYAKIVNEELDKAMEVFND